MLNVKEIIVERSSAGLTIAGLIGRPNNGMEVINVNILKPS